MAILMALAGASPPTGGREGRVVLMFQPAEENGAGAAAVLAESEVRALKPIWRCRSIIFPASRLGHALCETGR